ncbi:hypothetical protein HCA58_22630 [Micromonospora sp. HNM0581]|uniref:hypothetical protein n=1 Tax=Micromonospora sp. HNM0581 TaxID=2716341 RepID=UPI00146ECD74|nr:hypothetical protein [Micromonospora sp. HNM0581]NLU81089.1 hypothetical protein [Micromonospora sp. HNM0581]
MLLRQPGRLVLLGKVHQWHYGVHVYRTADYLSPLPPLRADQARQIGPSDTTWFGRWAHRFASWLDDTDAGPLHNGFWILRPRRLPPYCLRGDLVTNYPAAYLDWFGDGWNGVLPLRQLPDADDARVKAYRRQAREQVLPPILLWVVTGFDGYLLIDGHCRLAAALAEGIEPPVLGLAISSDPGGDSEWLNQVTTGHVELMDRLNEQAARGLADPSRAADALARRFADMCADLPEEGRTRAWPVTGGMRAWEQQAARVAPRWTANATE